MTKRRSRMSWLGRWLRIVVGNLLIVTAVQIQASAPAAAQDCRGDCNDDGSVTVDEVTLGVRIVLRLAPADDCVALTADGAAFVREPTIGDLIVAVNNLLDRCPAAFVATLNREQSVPSSSPGVEVQVSIQNMAPNLGTFQTPFWIGFHDGRFDSYDGGAPANLFFPDTNALERLAEDGSTGPISEAFVTQGFGTVDATLPGGTRADRSRRDRGPDFRPQPELATESLLQLRIDGDSQQRCVRCQRFPDGACGL